ncbi:hypothetical protein DICVIV_02700 [Dictyocaulus viviparus]|uniref:Uncharacterized protein n=1 Tax=Dictyocaulus viviparus TaxID=29172 RepID=A0A0D8Y348_DICVI|nr:hypothetical protein DICVIV_02700 [Dictyocaulus viviparus]
MKKKSIRCVIRAKNYHEFFQTVWAACRAVIFGCIVIVVGLAMTVLGYFDKQFSERMEIVDGTIIIYHNRLIQYQLKSMQYLGPILMGIGSFILIIACVVTLESRDKHTQIISEETMSSKKQRIPSVEEHTETAEDVDSLDEESNRLSTNENRPNIDMHRHQIVFSISTWVEVHRPGNGLTTSASNCTAPLAEIDSMTRVWRNMSWRIKRYLHSCSSQIITDRETNAFNCDIKEK